jgi:hypothetical protein
LCGQEVSMLQKQSGMLSPASPPTILRNNRVVKAVKKAKGIGEQWLGDDNVMSHKAEIMPRKNTESPAFLTDTDEDDNASIDRAFTGLTSSSTPVKAGITTENYDEDEADEDNNIQDEGYGEVDENEDQEDELVRHLGKAKKDNNNHVGFIRPTQMSLQDALSRFESLSQRWIINNGEANQLYDMERSLKLAKANFKIDYNDLRQEELDETHSVLRLELLTVMNIANMHQKMLGAERFAQMQTDLGKMLQQCYTTYEMLSAMYRHKTNTCMIQSASGVIPRCKLQALDEKQEMMQHIYRVCYNRNYRLLNGDLYSPVFTARKEERNKKGELVKVSGGHFTHSFKYETDLMDFVCRNCDRSVLKKFWRFATRDRKSTKATIVDICEALKLLPDHQLPRIRRDRHKFAFANGILLTNVVEPDPQNPHQKKMRTRFYFYDDPDISKVSAECAAAKFFDLKYSPFPDDQDWYQIPTQLFDSILHYQHKQRSAKEREEIIRFMFMNIGRMMFNRGEFDNWQYMVHLQGIGGTGKSTILEHVVKEIYEASNRFELDNKIEEQFGLGAIKDKDVFITISSELNKDCQLDTTQMLKMCSGEEITVARKHADPMTIRWPSHWMAAENDFPEKWMGLGIFRRCLFFMFLRSVRDRDKKTDLKERLVTLMPNIIQKSVRAYHEYVNKYGLLSGEAKDIWLFCPKYFLETKQNFQNNTNFLLAYLSRSGRVKASSPLIVSEEDLIRDYKEYCAQNNLSARQDLRNKETAFQAVIQTINDLYDLNIEIRSENNLPYRGQIVWQRQNYFMGIGLYAHLTEAEKVSPLIKNPADCGETQADDDEEVVEQEEENNADEEDKEEEEEEKNEEEEMGGE